MITTIIGAFGFNYSIFKAETGKCITNNRNRFGREKK